MYGLLSALLLATVASGPLQSQILNKNLIVNGDAESGPAAAAVTDPKISNIPGWTTTGGFSVGRYGDTGDFLSASDFAPVNRGQQLFFGGRGSDPSSATQTIDLSAAASDIDAGRIKFILEGYLGYLGGSSDKIATISLAADFLDANGSVLLRAVAPGPAQTDINKPAGILPRSATGFLPPNVRKARITLDLAVGESGTNAFAADNLALTLTTDPMTGVNLLLNGDAETPTGSDNGQPVPGWNAHTDLLVWKYDDYQVPKSTDPGPPNRGKYFFNCYTERAQCKAFQLIDISAAARTIDSGAMTYSLSGWLGGAQDWPDNVALDVAFYDSQGNAMTAGSATLGPVTQQDRNGQIGLLQRATSGTVPARARVAKVTLTFTKVGPPTDNMYAYADSISFTVDVLQVTTVVNAGSWQTGAIAPGEFITVGGSGLGPAGGFTAQGVQKGAGGTRVFINNIEAYLTYSSSNQVNAIVPYGIGNAASLTVQYNGRTSDPFPLQVAPASPGIFTQSYGGGQAWAVNGDGKFNGKDSPVPRGGVIAFWATGQGAVSPAGQDGEGISGWKDLTQQVKVTVGGVDAEVQFKGLIYTGEIQVNAKIPDNAPTGDAELILTIGNNSSRKGVTVTVK